MKLYSKDYITERIAALDKADRLPHGLLITGEEKSGRYTTAKYLCQIMLCTKKAADGMSCGECAQCRRIENDSHPDVIIPEGEGKTGTYKTDNIRANVVADTFTPPNDGDRKIYIFREAEKLSVPVQNVLLKTLEEPPDYVYFIIIAQKREALLDTVLSRIVELNIKSSDKVATRQALSELGSYDEKETERAVDAFGSNIGKALEFVENGNIRRLYEITVRLAHAIADGNEYMAVTTLIKTEDRREIATVVSLLRQVIKDALVLKYGGDVSSLTCCYSAGAELISRRVGEMQLMKIDSKLSEAGALALSPKNLNGRLIQALISSAVTERKGI